MSHNHYLRWHSQSATALLQFASVALLFFSNFSLAQLNPSLPPGKNFDLSAWKMHTLDENRNFREATPAQLSNGYVSPFFFTDPVDGAMVFKTPVNGKTTVSTSHPRIELRQVSGGGNWPLTDTAEHRLDAMCRVISVAPDTPKTVIGQIHGSDKKSQLLKLIWDGNKKGKCTIKANFKNNDDEKKDLYYKLATGLSLGDTVSYTLTMRGGVLSVTANGKSASQTYTPEYLGTADRYYFKAGNYLQCSGDDPDIFGVVKFNKLSLDSPGLLK